VVLESQRRPEQRHEPVAKELIDRAFVAVDLGQRHLEEAIDEGVHRVRAKPIGQRRGVGHVTEQHRDDLALALDGVPGGEDLLGEVLRGVGVRRRHGRPGWGRRGSQGLSAAVT
jgi:hypothetical protein